MEHFTLSAAGFDLYGVHWKTESPRGVLCLIHGLGEYAERYDTTARYFVQSGLAVLAIDLPGYGHNDGTPGEVGTVDQCNFVLQEMINYAKNLYPELPLFLFGHSLGGNLCLSYRLRQDTGQVCGYVLSSPWLRLYVPLKAAHLLLVRTSALLFPRRRFHVGDMLKADHNRDKPPEVGEDFVRDPLLRPYATLSTLVSRMREAQQILRHPRAGNAAPVFIFQGERDRICSSEASRQFIAQCGEPSRFLPVENAGHETMHCPSYFATLDQSLAFINEIIERRESSC